MKLKELSQDSLPREKALKKGIASLSDQELLAIILGSGTKGKNVLELASEIVSIYRDFPTLATTQIDSFYSIRGISQAKAISLAATFEIARRSNQQAPYLSTVSPSELYDHYQLSLGQKKNESLLLLCYDKRKRIRKEKYLFEGDENELSASIKMILSELNDPSCSSFIIMHNHPSGIVLPSKGEIEFTANLKARSLALGVELLDHMILSASSYFSFKENGLLV